MFKNIGKKIKVLAYIVCFIGIATGIITGISMGISTFYASNAIFWAILTGVVIAAVIAVLSWVGSFAFYGYGQLIEDTRAIRNKTESEQPED